MNASPSQPHPAEWTETQGLLPSVERDLPAGRHQFHKEQTDGPDPRRPPHRPPRRPRTPQPVPAPGDPAARRGLRPGRRGRGRPRPVPAATDDGTTSLATGPALTTRIGTADAKGADRSCWTASPWPPPTPPAPRCATTSSSTSRRRWPAPTRRRSTTRPRWSARSCTPARSGSPSTAGRLADRAGRDTSDDGITLAGPNPISSAYDHLAELPTDPDALLRKIYQESDANRDPEVPPTRRPSSPSAIC